MLTDWVCPIEASARLLQSSRTEAAGCGVSLGTQAAWHCRIGVTLSLGCQSNRDRSLSGVNAGQVGRAGNGVGLQDGAVSSDGELH